MKKSQKELENYHPPLTTTSFAGKIGPPSPENIPKPSAELEKERGVEKIVL